MRPNKNDTQNSNNDGGDDLRMDLPDYCFPSAVLLKDLDVSFSTNEVIETKECIISFLRSHNIRFEGVDTTVGYSNTLYEVTLSKGLRISQLKKLYPDLVFHLGTPNISIEPIFERGTIGIIVPNQKQTILPIKAVIESEDFTNSDFDLPLIIGQTLTHKNIIVDLSDKGHILVSGATGQGKSVLLNVMINSLLYKKHPAELKLVLFDPMLVELNLYSPIKKHFLAGLTNNQYVVSDTRQAWETLNAIIGEMEDRLRLLVSAGCRNIKEYNSKFRKRLLNPQDRHRFLPYIVTVIDRFSDLSTEETQNCIGRIVNKGQAAGIHVILSVQRPADDILREDIRNNFPVRIAFRTTERKESRLILEEDGAELLSGNGDAIYKDTYAKKRVQVPFISTKEVTNIAAHISNQQGYEFAYALPDQRFYPFYDEALSSQNIFDNLDPLFEEAARLIVVHQQGSTSLIQRKFSIGYNRAGRLMDQLEAAGIVGETQGSHPREVYISDEYRLEKLLEEIRGL